MGLLALMAVAMCVGCGPRHVPLPGDYYDQDGQRVAVVVVEPGHGNLYKVGNQGLLDMAIADAMTQALQERLLQLAASNVVLFAAKAFFEAGLDARGLDASAAGSVVSASDLPAFEGGDDVRFARLDVRQIASATGASHVLVLDTSQWGLTRKYYSMVALGPPRGFAKIQGLLVDGGDNSVVWRKVAEGEAEIAGPWNDPSEYPAAVSAVSAGLTSACEQLSADLRLPPPSVVHDAMVDLLTSEPGAFAETAPPMPALGDAPADPEVTAPVASSIAAGRPPAGPAAQFAIGPQVIPLAGNNFNDEFAVGFNAGVRLQERFIVEALFLGFVKGIADTPDEHNQTSLANAVTMLTEEYYLEMYEPKVSLIARVRGTPLRGVMPGTPVGMAVDLYAGGGLLAGDVELGGIDWDVGGARAVHAFEADPLPALNYGVSLKLLPHPSVAIRLDLQAITSFDQVLDFTDPLAAEQNRYFRYENPMANRLDCNSTTDAVCRATTETITMIGFGFDFYLPAEGGTP